MFVLSFVAYKLYTKVINIVFFIINQFIISVARQYKVTSIIILYYNTYKYVKQLFSSI